MHPIADVVLIISRTMTTTTNYVGQTIVTLILDIKCFVYFGLFNDKVINATALREMPTTVHKASMLFTGK